MDSTVQVIFLLLVFGSVFLVGYSLFSANFSAASLENKQLHQRLSGLAEGAGHLQPNQRYMKEVPALEQMTSTLPGMAKVDRLIKQAGYRFPAYQLVFPVVIFAGLAWLSLAAVLPRGLGPVLFIACLWLPLAALKVVRGKRLEKFDEQMPDALDMITRALRAGHRFNDAMQLVAKELPAPLGDEFATTFDELNYGMDIRLAFQRMQERTPSTSLKALLTSVLVQRDSGGNLAEILTKISAVIRARFRFDRKVRTLTAEGRMSVWVLGLLPFVLFGILSLANPDYMDTLTDKPEGRKLILYGFALMAVGILWVRRIIRIQI
jgi:tight adherence protein B